MDSRQTRIIEVHAAMGFDTCRAQDDGSVRLGCSQCAALSIQGMATHEPGCPNEVHECKGCNALVPRGHQYCPDCR